MLQIDTDDTRVLDVQGLSPEAGEQLEDELDAVIDGGGSESLIIMNVVRHLYDSYTSASWVIYLHWLDGHTARMEYTSPEMAEESSRPSSEPINRISRYERKPVI